MNPVDGDAAAQTLLSWGVCDPGYCLHYVWQAYAAHGATSSESYGTAYEGWLGSAGQHPGDWNPPSGVPVYLGPRSGSNAGDVMISLGGGMCAATDWPYNGVIGTCSISQRCNQTGRPYLGWTETILNYPITSKEWNSDMPLNADTDYEAFVTMLQRAWKYDLRINGVGINPGWEAGYTPWERFNNIDNAVAALTAPSVEIDYDKLAAALKAQGITMAVVTPNG